MQDILEAIMTENFAILMTAAEPQIRRAQRSFKRKQHQKNNISTLRHVIFILQKNQRQRENSSRSQRKKILYLLNYIGFLFRNYASKNTVEGNI